MKKWLALGLSLVSLMSCFSVFATAEDTMLNFLIMPDPEIL